MRQFTALDYLPPDFSNADYVGMFTNLVVEIRIRIKIEGEVETISFNSLAKSNEDFRFMYYMLLDKQKPLPDLFWDLFERGELSVTDDLGSLFIREISYPTKRMKKVINEESIKELVRNTVQTNDIVMEPSVERLQSLDFKIVSPQTPITRTILDKYSLKNVAYNYLKLDEHSWT